MGNNKIGQMQLISIGCCYVMGTIVVSSFISTVAGSEAWMSGILGLLGFAPALLCYLALARRYPGLGLFEINEAVFGPALGRVLSGIYWVFFLTLCALNILEASNFLRYFIMPETPLPVIAGLFVLGCVYGARKGILPIARVSTLFGLASLGGLLLNLLLSLSHANFEYLLPMLNRQGLDYIQMGHIAAAIPFGESLVLMMLLPRLSPGASVKKAYGAVTLFTALVMVLIHFREGVTLGYMAGYATLSSYEAVRMISVASTLTRTESLFALLLVSMTFFKTLILFYACTSGACQIFRLESGRHILLMLAALVTVYAINAYSAPNDSIFWGKNVSPFIWSFFTLGLPLLTLLGAWLRKRVRQP